MRWWGVLARALLALVLVAFVALVVMLGQSADWDAVKASAIVQQFWDQYSTLIDRIYSALDKTVRLVTPIGTLLGIAYGIYHKWQYSRSRMHVHIRSFLERDNPRLETTRDNLKEAHKPPGAARDISESIFSSAEVQRKLKLMRWGRRLSKADELLDEELGKISEQVNQWGNLQANYDRNKAYAHLLRGAIAASRAAEATDGESRSFDLAAFEAFKAAHDLDHADEQALEYMAHQRIRLGDLTGALSDFKRLEALAQKMQEDPGKKLSSDPLVVRAKKLQAIVLEKMGIERLRADEALAPTREPNLLGAWRILDSAIGALSNALLGGLDEAELYELRGRVHKSRRSRTRSTNDLIEAERLNDRLANSTTVDDETKAAALAGLDRVRRMQQEIRLSVSDAPDDPDTTPDPGGSNGAAQLSAPQPPATTLTKTPAT